MLAKPENREEAVAKLFKSVGGKAYRVVVCTENSNSDIMVMQSAKDRVGMDTSSC
jgi:hypothetical protein